MAEHAILAPIATIPKDRKRRQRAICSPTNCVPNSNPNPRPSTPTVHKRLPSKQHQIRIQRNRQQKMRNNHRTQRKHGRKKRDVPIIRHQKRHTNQHSREPKANDKRPLEPLQYARNLLKESDAFNLFSRSAPRHFNAEHMTEQSLTNM